jgi:hypothetical protein
MKHKKIIVKVTIPRIITDNPMACFTSRDGKFEESVPINANIIRWLNGKNEGYFELTMNAMHIIAMKPVEESKYLSGEKPSAALKLV